MNSKEKKCIFVEDWGDSQAEAIMNCITRYHERAEECGYPSIEVDFANIRQVNNKLKVRCSLKVKKHENSQAAQ